MFDALLFLLPALALLAIAFLVMGFIAFLRTAALTHALRQAETRIAALERERAAQSAPAEAVAAAPEPAPAEPVSAPEASQPGPEPQAPPAPKPERLSVFARIEKTLASNWFVWLGGALIAAAIVSFLHYAVQRGFFGPAAQLACAYLVGAALIGAGEWLRRGPPPALAQSQFRHLPALLAALGLFAWFMATWAGYTGLHALGARAAFALMTLSAAAAILVALRFGRWLALLGLAGGYLTPALIEASTPVFAALFAYLVVLTAAALAIIRIRNWRGFVWLAGGGALAWGLLWTSDLLVSQADQRSAGFYILALALLGLAFGWSEARAPLRLNSWRTLRANWSESILAAHVIAFAAGADLLLLALHGQYDPIVLATILALCAAVCLAAVLRESFALIALGAAALGAATILCWPSATPEPDAPPLAAYSFFILSGALGFLFSASGWLMMNANRAKSVGATLCAFGPLAIMLASHTRAAELRLPLEWTGAAAFLAALNAFGLWQLSRAFGGMDKTPGPSAAFSLGAAAGAILAVLFAFSNQAFWGPAALALLAPAMAALDLRFKLPALRVAASVTALIVIWLLGPSLRVFSTPLGPSPLLNPILPVYAISAAAFLGAARIYRRGALSADTRIAQTLEASALILAALGVSFEIRSIATGGDLGADEFGLAEISADLIAWTGLALGMAARFGPKPRAVLFWGELIIFIGAALLALFGAGLIDNPWWGFSPARAPGAPIFNLLLAAYGLPAALFAAYSILRRRQGLGRRGAISGAIAVILAFLNVTLEVRRLYHGPAMVGAPIGQWEAWSYTAAWISFAAALLALGLIRRQPSLRYASVIVLLAAILKAFGFDIQALNGVLLAAQMLGLGLSVIAVTVIYQRFVAPRDARDPNLIPPR